MGGTRALICEVKSMTPVGGTLIREVKVIVPMGGNVICKDVINGYAGSVRKSVLIIEVNCVTPEGGTLIC